MLVGYGVNVWEPMGGRVLPENIVGGGAVFIYDITRGFTNGAQWVNQASGSIAADDLVSAAWPAYTASNPLLGGRPSVAGDGIAQYLQSRTPANASILAQPSTWFTIGVYNGAGSTYYWDSAVNGSRNVMSRSAGNVSIHAGTSQVVYAISLTPALVMTRFWGANSLAVRRTGGADTISPLVNAGVQSCKGVTLFNAYNLPALGWSTFAVTVHMGFPGDRTSRWNAMKTWASQYAGIA